MEEQKNVFLECIFDFYRSSVGIKSRNKKGSALDLPGMRRISASVDSFINEKVEGGKVAFPLILQYLPPFFDKENGVTSLFLFPCNLSNFCFDRDSDATIETSKKKEWIDYEQRLKRRLCTSWIENFLGRDSQLNLDENVRLRLIDSMVSFAILLFFVGFFSARILRSKLNKGKFLI